LKLKKFKNKIANFSYFVILTNEVLFSHILTKIANLAKLRND